MRQDPDADAGQSDAEHRAGNGPGLAILDRQRHKLLPAVPSVTELNMPGLVMATWFGIATDCAMGIVALEAISPISTLA